MSACDGAIVETACATDKWARQRGSAVLLPLLLLAAAVPVVAWAWQWATYFLVAVLAVAVVGAALYVDNLLCVRRRAGAQRRHEEYARQLRNLTNPADTLWRDVRGQDIAEYAVMLAVILVIVIGTIHMVGSNSNNVFSSVASSMQ
jgi:Flp pilus assembly pilin Flp